MDFSSTLFLETDSNFFSFGVNGIQNIDTFDAQIRYYRIEIIKTPNAQIRYYRIEIIKTPNAQFRYYRIEIKSKTVPTHTSILKNQNLSKHKQASVWRNRPWITQKAT